MKVAIVGAAPSSRSLAPFKDESWSIWALSPSNMQLPRISQWFELHDLEDLKSDRWAPWANEYLAWLNRAPFAIWMQERNELVPKALPFPKDDIIKDLGKMFLTSTVAWMLAMAIKIPEIEAIGLWGVDMTADTEYEYERPGVQYWMSVARQKGIPLVIPPQSDLNFSVPLYGFGDAQPIARKLKAQARELTDRIAILTQHISDHETQMAKLVQTKIKLQGSLEENTYVRRTFFCWSGPDTCDIA